MRLSNLLLSIVLPITVLAFAAACHDHTHDDYPTFQACFDEHTEVEGFNATMAITICVLEHPIDGAALELATAAECVAYVEAELADTAATAAEITAGCDDYIAQRDQ